MATKETLQKLKPRAVSGPSPAEAATGLAVVPIKPVPKKPGLKKPVAKKTATRKKKPAVRAEPELVISLETLQDEIRQEAYGYFIQRGYRPADPKADWHRAEDAVLRRHGRR